MLILIRFVALNGFKRYQDIDETCKYIVVEYFQKAADKQEHLPDDPASDLNFEEAAIDNLCQQKSEVIDAWTSYLIRFFLLFFCLGTEIVEKNYRKKINNYQ